jgi:carbamoyltransferase
LPDSRTAQSGWILGINPGTGGFNYHDPAAVLVRHGQVFHAVEEERFTRTKAARGLFPSHSIHHCLHTAGITFDDLDEVAIGFSPAFWWERVAVQLRSAVAKASRLADRRLQGSKAGGADYLQELVGYSETLRDIASQSAPWLNPAHYERIFRDLLKSPRHDLPLHYVGHHLAHAASAWYPSLFPEATIVVIDGAGEAMCSSAWVVDGSNEFKLVASESLPNSLGYFYAAFTHYLGFEGFLGEGKVMALAPYGEPDEKISQSLEKIAKVTDEGYDVSDFILELLGGTGVSLNLERAVTAIENALGAPARSKARPLEPFHRNVAYAVQNFLERAAQSFVRSAIAKTGVPLLCLSGGVFLNCKLNGLLREAPYVKQLFVQPVARDSGVALGAALYRSMQSPGAQRHAMPTLGLGPAPSCYETALQAARLPYDTPADLSRTAAEMIASGKVLLWFEGGGELGPRALGHRSILADPRNPEMREIVNQIKKRENWRPFGCSMLEHRADGIMETALQNRKPRYMIEAFRVREEWRSRIPAVVHPADFTTRPQTVDPETEPRLHELLTAFESLTGVPVLLNTSLNGPGEPLANHPEDAIRMFFTCPADALVMGRHILMKK